ncbi:hypothetical protein HQ560_10430 [bacterium]|nr:hypothetical protein [bacterium]
MLRRSGRGTTLAHDPRQLAELGYWFQERAGILEHDGGLSREEADRLAWAEIAAQMDADDGCRAAARGATEHWKPFKPDRDALAT